MGFWLRRVHTKQDYIDIVEILLCMRDLPGNPIMQQTFYLFKREIRFEAFIIRMLLCAYYVPFTNQKTSLLVCFLVTSLLQIIHITPRPSSPLKLTTSLSCNFKYLNSVAKKTNNDLQLEIEIIYTVHIYSIKINKHSFYEASLNEIPAHEIPVIQPIYLSRRL